MKKILMTMVAAVIAVSASAQVYVGGGFSVQGNDDGNNHLQGFARSRI